MGDPVIAAFGIIHGNSCSSSLLSEEITQKHLAKAGIDSSMTLLATMLLLSNSNSALSISKNGFAHKLVVDLELRVHELDESHLVHKIDSRFLQDFNISDDLPGLWGEIISNQGVEIS